jgi:hypothetical protein
MARQKLVTVFFNETLERPTRKEAIQEHLESYLSTGWRVLQIHPGHPAGAGGVAGMNGWFVVLLELADPPGTTAPLSASRE